VSAQVPISRSLSEVGGSLSETEQKAVARLLSDPSYFPMEFRAWIKNYIESSDITFPASSILGLGASASGRTQLPAGIVLPYAGNNYGPDVLPCNGASLDRNDYDKLFAAIGVTWGSADATHFNVPDLRDRALYMAGSSVALGATDGLATGSRGGPFHHHAVNIATDTEANHRHNANANNYCQTNGTQIIVQSGADFQFYQVGSFSSNTAPGGNHSHQVNGNTGGGFGLAPSYAGVIYVITTAK